MKVSAATSSILTGFALAAARCDDVCTEQCSVNLNGMQQFFMYNAIHSIVEAVSSGDSLTSSLSLYPGNDLVSSQVDAWYSAQTVAANYIAQNIIGFQQVFQLEVVEWVEQLRYVLETINAKYPTYSNSQLGSQVLELYKGQANMFNVMSKVATSCQDCLYWSRSIIPHAEAERTAMTEFIYRMGFDGYFPSWASYIECSNSAPTTPASAQTATSTKLWTTTST